MNEPTQQKRSSLLRKALIGLAVVAGLGIAALLLLAGARSVLTRIEARELASTYLAEHCPGGAVTDVSSDDDVKYPIGCGDHWSVPGYRITVEGCGPSSHIDVACLPFADSCVVTTGMVVVASDCGQMF